MKINETSKAKQVLLESLRKGDVFRTDHGVYYMKTENVMDKLGFPCDAVRLDNGILCLIDCSTPVFPVDCELTIK